MKSILFNVFLLSVLCVNAQGTIPVPISTDLFFGNQDEWIHLKITDTLTNQVWYDTIATVTVSNGFTDTVYLESATYKCEVLDIGVNVNMPVIELDDGSHAQWGYPDYEYYLFTLPVSTAGLSRLSTEMTINFFPNPINDFFKIDIPKSSESVIVTILDDLGRIVAIYKSKSKDQITIDSSTFEDGNYFIQVESENHIKTTQLVKIGY